MKIKPKKRLFVEPPRDGCNPYYIGVHVSDQDTREKVNQLKDEPWAMGDSISFDRLPIPDGKMNGYFVVNKCFDVGEVIELLDSLNS